MIARVFRPWLEELQSARIDALSEWRSKLPLSGDEADGGIEFFASGPQAHPDFIEVFGPAPVRDRHWAVAGVGEDGPKVASITMPSVFVIARLDSSIAWYQ